MNFKNVATIYLKELRDAVRDRRTLMSTILIPTIVMPAMTFGMFKIGAKIEASNRQEIPAVMIIGGDDSPGVLKELRAATAFRIVPTRDDYKQQVVDKKIRAAVGIPAGFEASLARHGAERVTIYYYQGEGKSRYGVEALEKFFGDLRDRHVQAALAERSLPATFAKPFETERKNVAPPEKVGGNVIGGLVPYIIIILCFTGAMYPAMDLTAGEKERGTMETLLCSPAARSEIVLGKFLLVLTGSLSAMFMSITSMSVTAVASGLAMIGGRGGAAAMTGTPAPRGAMPNMSLDPVGLVGVLALVLPVAVLFSAVQFAVALFARSTKEAQSYLGPMIFVVIMPAAIGLMPGIDLNAKLALVPLLNISLACKEMLSGTWHWGYIALIFGSSSVYAAVALAWAVQMFKREDVIFRT
jgi:sodium transport system permease protein